MIFLGIKDDGFIDIKSTLVEGHVKVGLVGVTLIFLGVLLAFVATVSKAGRHKVRIVREGTEIEWDGVAYSQQEALKAIEDLADTLHKSEAIQQSQQPD